jgi:hypothetical protein
LREALRRLWKTPGVTATAVITLTLGIGATTAIFTLVNEVMLKSLPVAKPNELWLRGAFGPVGVGLAIGLPAAIGAGNLIATQLFGVTPWDPVMLAYTALLLSLTALAASMIPAWRAAGIEPMTALRTE